MTENVLSKIPDFYGIQDSRIGHTGWHSTVVDSHGNPLGSGCNSEKSTSRRIAIAEAIERASYKKIIRDEEEREKWLIDSHPSTSGFAVGFEEHKTAMRAIFEAVERWAWSNWIDYCFKVNLLKSYLAELSPFSNEVKTNFEKVHFFRKELVLAVAGYPRRLFFEVAIGEIDNGVFPGSRVSNILNGGWDHALIEAYRHLLIFRNHKEFDDYPYDRIQHFGKNKAEAFSSIKKASRDDWPTPKVDFLRVEKKDNFFLARALCCGFTPWNEGSCSRFVY